MKAFKWSILSLFCLQVSIAAAQSSVFETRLSKLKGPIRFTSHASVEDYIQSAVKNNKADWELALGKTTFYFPEMKDTLAKYQVPQELVYAALGWSLFEHTRISDDGGSGFWQMRYIDAKKHSVYISSYVDMRRDYRVATGAAARYFKSLYAEYGDWYLCVAAFAMGEVEVNKAIRLAGGSKKYWDFHPHLPVRYQHVVPAFIAGAYLHHYFKEHKMEPKPYKPDPFRSVEIVEWSSLYQVSAAIDAEHTVLQELNPVFKKDVIPNASRTYSILIPEKCYERFRQLGDSVYTFPVSAQVAGEVDPAKTGDSSPRSEERTVQPVTTTAQASGTKVVYYTVRSGDYLGRVADIYDVGVSQVRKWNGLTGDRINVNQKLKIYVPASKYDTYSKYNGYSRAQLDQVVKRD